MRIQRDGMVEKNQRSKMRQSQIQCQVVLDERYFLLYFLDQISQIVEKLLSLRLIRSLALLEQISLAH